MARIGRILCPIDFSDASRHAADHALVFARWYSAPVTFLHVYSPPFVPIPGLPPPQSRVPESELKRAEAEAAAWFADAASQGVTVDIHVEVGQPADCILDRAAALDEGLLVMGTHGTGGFERLLIGSVAEKVLRRATCPVLTVPPRAQTTSRLPFARLLCAVDFSDSSLAALDLALSLSAEFNAVLTVLHVIEWPWDEPPAPVFAELPPEQAASLAEYRRYLERGAVDRLMALVARSASGTRAPSIQVAHGKSYAEVLRLAADEATDLIVMGVHGRNTADMLMFGSTTNQVVRRATCPVLTLRR